MDTIFTDSQVETSATDARITSSEEYLSLVQRSGLISPQELAQAADGFRAVAKRRGFDAASLAYYLLQLKLITPWQTKMLLAGRCLGFILGQCKILDRIGSGGMGAVYLAEQLADKRPAAVKVLHRETDMPDARVQRFLAECKAAASLDHPHIIRAYRFGQEYEHYYLVMEYLEGMTLQQKVDREGPLPFPTAAKYVMQAALGLAHAHSVALIHRDVKPANLMVDKSDTVKLLDLGLAHHLNSKSDSLTQDRANKVVGTADYVAPEQVQDSHDVDARTDVYGLGATFYYLLTGTPPFPDGNLAHKLAAQLYHNPPPLRERRPETPPPLQYVCQRMMAKRREDRFDSAAEVARVLEQWLTTGEVEGFLQSAPAVRTSKDTIDTIHSETYHPTGGAVASPGRRGPAGDIRGSDGFDPRGSVGPAAASAGTATGTVSTGSSDGIPRPEMSDPARAAWKSSDIYDDDPPRGGDTPRPDVRRRKRPRRKPGDNHAWHPVMTLTEVSEYLRLGEEAVRALVRESRIPCQSIGNELRFHKKAVDQWLQDSGGPGNGSWGAGAFRASWDEESVSMSVSAVAGSAASLRMSRGELLDLLARLGLRDGDSGKRIAFLSDNNPALSMLDFARLLVEHQILTEYQFASLTRGEADTLRIGEHLILDRLGSGGTATVLKARNLRTFEVVALKTLDPEALADPEELRRFEREMSIAQQLNHPNIVMAFGAIRGDVPVSGGPAPPRCLVMECVNGTDLDRLIRNHGPLPVLRAVEYVLQAAHGLQYAHSRGLTHRDVKPGNLLVDDHGAVKILDLGLVRCERNWLQLAAEPPDRITKLESVLGTPDYMAPEQFLDPRTADSRSDIYGLGCTLCFLLTGQPPFPVSPAPKVFRAHQMDPVPNLLLLRAEIPRSLQQVFSRMMQKNPAHRYATMEQVAADLETLVLPELKRSRNLKIPKTPAGRAGAAPAAAEFVLVSFMGGVLGALAGSYLGWNGSGPTIWLAERFGGSIQPAGAGGLAGGTIGLLAAVILFRLLNARPGPHGH